MCDSNLGKCVEALYAVGVFTVVVQLDPRLFAHPQNRPRLYLVLYSRAFMETHGMSEQEVYNWTCNFIDTFCVAHGMVPLDEFLYPDSSPLIQELLKKTTDDDVDQVAMS